MGSGYSWIQARVASCKKGWEPLHLGQTVNFLHSKWRDGFKFSGCKVTGTFSEFP